MYLGSVRERLLTGPESVRMPGERQTLTLCLLTAPIVIALVGTFFHAITINEVALVVVVGLVFVSLARGRLLGSSIRVTEHQFPEVFHDVQEIASRLGLVPPVVFLRDDPFVPITSIGTEEPYALVISSQYFDFFTRGELRFLIARELGHIAAGHTRIQSIFSASGRENPFVSVVFGAWLRKTEYTADRVGLLFADEIQDAVNAIAITTFHAVGRRVNHAVLAEQRRELEEDPRLRLGEWSSPAPFATNRIRALGDFAIHPLARQWRAELAQAPSVVDPPHEVRKPGDTVTRADCSSPARRLAALCIDLIVIQAIVQSGLAFSSGSHTLDLSKNEHAGWLLAAFPFLKHLNYETSLNPELFLGFFVYAALLVALAGQTLGMMIVEIRVVTPKFGRVTPGRAILHYVVAMITSLFVAPAVIGFFMKRQPHDWLSATRVVLNQRARAKTRR